MTRLLKKHLRWIGRVAVALAGVVSLASEPSWELSNGQIRMRVEPQGAIISDLRMVNEGTSWLEPKGDSESSEPFAHFLCFDRWGPVTATENSVGFDFHGEAARIPWVVTSAPTSRGLEVTTTLPLARLRADRKISLPRNGGGYRIQTLVQNPTSDSRPFNFVEHITLADRWNDPAVRMITNARRGVLHVKGRPVAGAEVDWPYVTQGDSVWDMRAATDRRGRHIAAMRFPKDAAWGWICLQDPQSGALLAYVWRTAEMPWLNLYWWSNGERIVRRAIEPGSTGSHRPMSELLRAPAMLDLPVIHRITSGETREFSLFGGLALAGSGFGELASFHLGPDGWIAEDPVGNELVLIPME